jgi:hypothetical protein
MLEFWDELHPIKDKIELQSLQTLDTHFKCFRFQKPPISLRSHSTPTALPIEAFRFWYVILTSPQVFVPTLGCGFGLKSGEPKTARMRGSAQAFTDVFPAKPLRPHLFEGPIFVCSPGRGLGRAFCRRERWRRGLYAFSGVTYSSSDTLSVLIFLITKVNMR